MGFFSKVASAPGNVGASIAKGLGGGEKAQKWAGVAGGVLTGGALLGPGGMMAGGYKEMMGRVAPQVQQLPGLPGVDPRIKEQIEGKKKEQDKLREKLAKSEDEARGSLLRQASVSGQAIDEQLQASIEESGFLGGEERRAVGAQQYAAGLGRTGLTAQRVEQAHLRETQRKASARAESMEKRRGVAEQVVSAQQTIADRRREIEGQMLSMEMSGLTSERFQQEAQRQEMDYNRFVNDLEINASKKAELMSALGGFAQGGGMAAGFAKGGSGGGSGGGAPAGGSALNTAETAGQGGY